MCRTIDLFTLTSDVAKIFEKMFHIRLSNFVTVNQTIERERFGLQAKKSTSDAVAEAMRHFTKAIECNCKVAGLFIDMFKACVNHDKLITLLKRHGVSGVAKD